MRRVLIALILLMISSVAASAACTGGTNGTPKTTTVLTQSEFQDGQAAGSIVPACLRDFVASGPQWDTVSSAAAPYVTSGNLNVAAYFVAQGGVLGVVSSGQRTTNCTALQAAINYGVTNTLTMQWYGRYEISCVAGIVIAATGQQFTIHGSMAATDLVQFYNTGTGAPILTIGDTTGANFSANDVFDGIELQYGSAQTISQTNAAALQVGSVGYSDIRNINIFYGASNMLPYRAMYFPGNGSGFFSNQVSNIFVSGCQYRCFDFETNATGNLWSNMYFNNNINSVLTQVADSPFYMDGTGGSWTIGDQHFDRLNVEIMASTAPIIWIHQAAILFTALHLENILMGTVGGGVTTAGPLVYDIGGQVKLISPTIFNLNLNTSLHSGTNAVFATFGNGMLTVDNPFMVQSSPPTTQNETVQLALNNGSGTTPSYLIAPIVINQAFINNWDAFPPNLDGTLTAAVTGDVRFFDGYRNPAAFPHNASAQVANPANNYVLVGGLGADVQVVYDTAIAGNLVLVLGLDYMGSGNGSSTLRPVGHQVTVTRTSTSTGNFNITVKNATSGGTTVGTFTGSGSAGTTQVFGFTGAAWTASP